MLTTTILATLVASSLHVEAPLGPGPNFVRAAEDSLAVHEQLTVHLKTTPGSWMKETKDGALGKPAGKATFLYRPLTAAEKAAGWAEETLGYYGSMLFTHADAPVDSISWKKWRAYVDAKKEPAQLRWSTIADVPKEKDAAVTWVLPDAKNRDWARPLVFAHGVPARILDKFKKEPAKEPRTAVSDVARVENGLALHGFDYVVARLDLPFFKKKTLKVDGVEPTVATLGDGSYKLARPVVLAYDAKLAAGADAPIVRFKRWLTTRPAQVVYESRLLVRPKGAATTH